jgi:hypothetical protein
VAVQAGYAVIHIATHATMFIIHILLVVLVAINTTEYSIIGRIDVTIGASVPFPIMFP